jgi:hypothetical protein
MDDRRSVRQSLLYDNYDDYNVIVTTYVSVLLDNHFSDNYDDYNVIVTTYVSDLLDNHFSMIIMMTTMSLL